MPLVSIDGKHMALPKPKTSRPRTPSISTVKSRAVSTYQEEVQRAYQNAMRKMVPIPTFSKDYFMPQDMMKQINQILKQKPNLNTKQLMSVAQTTISLLTNPQIEALRNQINELKKLQPQIKEQINANYSQAQKQVEQNTQNLIGKILQNVDQEGGLRSGVAAAVMANATANSTPISQALEQNRRLDVSTVIGALQAQQKNAQDMLKTIEKNKKNMTKAQYNTLKDQALQQWKAAQQQQLQILNNLANMEMSARQSAANLAQEKAAATNEFINQMLQNQLASLQSAQEDFMKNYLPQLQQDNLNKWLNYITSTARTGADALKILQQNKDDIISSVGQDGYDSLFKQLSKFKSNWVNPDYETPYTIVNLPGGYSASSNTSSSSKSSSSLAHNILTTLLNAVSSSLPLWARLRK